MDLETSRLWLNKWVVITYGTRHHVFEKTGILFSRDPETGHYLILEYIDDKKIWEPLFITGQSVQSVQLLEPQKDIFPPGIEKNTDIEEIMARASSTDASSFSDELVEERRNNLKSILTKQRIGFQEFPEGRILAMGSVSIWPPYRDVDCTSTAANATAALTKIRSLISKNMPISTVT